VAILKNEFVDIEVLGISVFVVVAYL